MGWDGGGGSDVSCFSGGDVSSWRRRRKRQGWAAGEARAGSGGRRGWSIESAPARVTAVEEEAWAGAGSGLYSRGGRGERVGGGGLGSRGRRGVRASSGLSSRGGGGWRRSRGGGGWRSREVGSIEWIRWS